MAHTHTLSLSIKREKKKTEKIERDGNVYTLDINSRRNN